MQTAIIHWTPLEFVFAVPTTIVLTVIFLGLANLLGEFIERKVVAWWTKN